MLVDEVLRHAGEGIRCNTDLSAAIADVAREREGQLGVTLGKPLHRLTHSVVEIHATAAEVSLKEAECPLSERVEDWPDERIWDELALRLPDEAASQIVRAPALEKSIAPLRSYVFAPMRHGSLMLCGDSAHIVPPTGAKGLNLAASDVHYAAAALTALFRHNDANAIAAYSDKALARVWKAERFSWSLTRLMHRFPEDGPFERAMQVAELDYIAGSRAAQTAIAENYVGLPV